MPLISLWTSNPGAVSEFRIEQVVMSAGDGVLKDASVCSNELRDYFTRIPPEKLASYAEQCLNGKFEKSGLVLQDLVNEVGRRLDFSVENGRYQGSPNAVGHDGLWGSPEGRPIVVEVKTTDAYRISLDTIAGYRDRLLKSGALPIEASVLIVVGREETGDLEAQVRGSRHAWDIRLISVDALTKLMLLKVNSDDLETGRKIRSVLTPVEFTRLDPLVDVMFTAASETDTKTPSEAGETVSVTPEPAERTPGTWEFTDTADLERKRAQILEKVSHKLGGPLIKKSRALFWTSDHNRRVVCTISKKYTRRRGAYPYWYAYHPQWDEFLKGGEGYLVLGCMDLPLAFSIPSADISQVLPGLNTTEPEAGRHYWHLHVVEPEPQKYALLVPNGHEDLRLDKYIIPLD